jgi:hypothetical protein
MNEDPRIREIRAALEVVDSDAAVPVEYLVDTVRAVLRESHPAHPAGIVRVFKYTKPNGPIYRAYPDGRVTRNGDEIDPSNLVHCEASVREGAMIETAVPLRTFRTTAIFDGPSDLGQRAKERP